MHRLLFLTVLLASATCAGAQITLRGTVSNIPLNGPRRMALEAWTLEQWQQVQVVSIEPDNSFSATIAAARPGQYRLRIWGQAKVWSDFIVADSAMADTELRFTLDNYHMTGNPAELPGSPANVTYAVLLNAQTRTTATLAQADAARAELNRLCSEAVALHPKTLIADIALLLYQPVPADFAADPAVAKMTANEFATTHALEKIPFHHDNILYHNAFVKALNRYYNYFSHDEAGSKAYVDGIMSRRNGNDAVDGFLFKYLLDRMMDAKQEGGLRYLLDWYAPDCTDEDPLPNGTQALLTALKACTPGNTVPDLVLPNPTDLPVALSDVCARQELTLLLFWRSTCSHCREFEPELVQIYAKYHPLGVEVYAMSSDKSKDDWLAFLQQNPTPWVNVFIPVEQRQEIARQFPAPSTPTLIAVDRKQRVVSRLISRGALESFLDSALQQQKGR